MAGLSINKLLKILFSSPQNKDDGLNIRKWFLIYCLYLAVLCIVSSISFRHYSLDPAQQTARLFWLIGLYMFYFSLASTFVPLPTSWFVLFLCSPAGGLTFLTPISRIIIIASVGALATAISHINEYHLSSYFLRLGKINAVRKTKLYNWSLKIFRTSPFLLQVVFNVIPIPADPARWIAIISKYPFRKFFLAHWSGRFIRYGLMGIAAELLKLTIAQIFILQALLILIPLLKLTYQLIRRKLSQPVPLDT